MVFVEGISLTPNQGTQTQNIPPITSVSDNKVRSAAGICLDPIEYKIKPRHTKDPWVANKASFFPFDKKLKSLVNMIVPETIAHVIPAIATVVNLGVSFFHLKLTENTANPQADNRPNNNPSNEVYILIPIAIMAIPMAAITIAIHTLKDTFSFKNKNPNNAVIKGMAAKHNNVTAAVVFVIDQMKVIIAVPSPIPPIKPDIPIFK